MATAILDYQTVDTSDPFTCGTIQYTPSGLRRMFFWLLWGDVAFILMESVVPSILPLKLHKLGAADWLLGLVLVTIPRAMDFIVNPVVSFMSDRTRSRWGRRRPYLLVATPLVAVTLVMMGFSSQISAIFARWAGSTRHQTAVAIGVLAGLMVLFQFVNMFINSTYYYLFNDVVPRGYLSRFMSLFRVVSMLAAAGYGYFIYGKAETHSQQIFLWTAAVYLVVFGLMCLLVKEGKYPPVAAPTGKRKDALAGVRSFLKDCFSHRIYWYFFLANACWATSVSCMSSFSPFYAASNGVSLGALGKMGAVNNLLIALALYPAGILSDKKHPLNVNLWGSIAVLCVIPLQFIFLLRGHLHGWAPILFFVICGLGSVTQAIYAASELPMYMKILPQDRYGQFCSANSMVRAIILMIGGPVAGLFLDYMRRFDHRPTDHYQYIPA
jgi:Na+/melibiose symporter-like transporter